MHRPTGAIYQDAHTCSFSVWAPFRESVKLDLEHEDQPPLEMEKDEKGYWQLNLEDIPNGTKYRFVLDEELTRPDPASRDQSLGVHDWSKTRMTNTFNWSDSRWLAPPLEQLIMYEIHTGTFSPEGTFEAIIPRLDHLLHLGVNAIEIMPVCQFSGGRNWGYDGVYPYAVQDTYGGAEGLKKLVDACHKKGIAVVLDVVYNHLGPEGNYLNDFGPYFTDKYHTPWGAALNFDDAYSDHVRSFFINAALMWLEEFHIDALRLDAVHAIYDNSAKHILTEMREETDQLEEKTGRRHYLIAESDLNDVKLLKPYQQGGCNLDAQWADDFHHSVHALATGEKKGYYADFGKVEDLAKTFRQAFVYDGAYSEYRKRKIGSDPSAQPPDKFVVCIQNHDQVGNRMMGERLSQLVSYEKTKLCAGVLLTSPFVPLLFMGEEYGEDHPFRYFVSHEDPQLIEAVRKGRKKEFESFEWQGKVPDPQADETFECSRLQWDFKEDEKKSKLLEYYRQLIALRKDGAFAGFAKSNVKTRVHEQNKTLSVASQDRSGQSKKIFAAFNFDDKSHEIHLPDTGGNWRKLFASSDERWKGPGNISEGAQEGSALTMYPESFILFQNQ